MKQFLNDQQLKDMTVPTVKLSQHQAQLRRVLVSRAAERADQKLTLRGAIYFMSKRKPVIASAAILSVLAIAVFSFVTVSQPAPVSALEVAQNSAKALSQLTTEEIMDMSPQELQYRKFYPQFVTWLKEAEQASDLRLLSYDQLVQTYPFIADKANPGAHEQLRVIDNPRDGTTPNVRELRYLEFGGVDGTTKSKYKIVVGVNNANIPEAALHHIVEWGGPRIGG